MTGCSWCLPDIQRPYSWEKSNVDDYIEDIIEASKKSKGHFFGLMLLKCAKSTQEIHLIDGQQRSLTSLLFAHVLAEWVTKHSGYKISARELQDEFLEVLHLRNIGFRKLDGNWECVWEKHIPSKDPNHPKPSADRSFTTVLCKILKGGNILELSRMSELALEKSERFDRRELDYAKKFLEVAGWLFEGLFYSFPPSLNNKKIIQNLALTFSTSYVHCVEFTSELEAQRFFLIFNTRGLSLSFKDLARANFFIKTVDRSLRGSFDSLLERLSACVVPQKYFEKLGVKNSFDLVMKIQRALLWFKEHQKISWTSFREQWDQGLTLDSFDYFSDPNTFLNVFKGLVVAIEIIFREKKCKAYFGSDQKGIKGEIILRCLLTLKDSYWVIPVILILRQSSDHHQTRNNDYKPADAEKVVTFLTYFEKFVLWTRAPNSGLYGTNAYETMLVKIMKSTVETSLSSIFIDLEIPQVKSEWEPFFQSLFAKTYAPGAPEIARYLLTRLEISLHQKDVCGTRPLNFHCNVTVEHLLPQKLNPESSWVKSDKWTSATHNDKIHSIGNLFLIDQPRNSAASNLDLEEKQEKYFRNKTKGQDQSTSFLLLQWCQNLHKFTPDDYQKRSLDQVTNLKSLLFPKDKTGSASSDPPFRAPHKEKQKKQEEVKKVEKIPKNAWGINPDGGRDELGKIAELAKEFISRTPNNDVKLIEFIHKKHQHRYARDTIRRFVKNENRRFARSGRRLLEALDHFMTEEDKKRKRRKVKGEQKKKELSFEFFD